MDTTEDRNRVEKSEVDLAKVLEEKKVTIEKKDAIRADLAKALRLKLLVGMDQKQEKIILDLEREMLLIDHKIEGLNLLTEELQDELIKSKDSLKAAIGEEQKALGEYINQKENEECGVLVSELEARINRFIDAYCEVCTQLGEFNLLQIRSKSKTVEEALSTLRLKALDGAKERGFRSLFGSGFFSELNVLPLVKAPQEPAGAILNGVEIEGARGGQRTQNWTEEFHKKGENQ